MAGLVWRRSSEGRVFTDVIARESVLISPVIPSQVVQSNLMLSLSGRSDSGNQELGLLLAGMSLKYG